MPMHAGAGHVYCVVLHSDFCVCPSTQFNAQLPQKTHSQPARFVFFIIIIDVSLFLCLMFDVAAPAACVFPPHLLESRHISSSLAPGFLH